MFVMDIQNRSNDLPQIILIGVDHDYFKVLEEFLEEQFDFVFIDNDISKLDFTKSDTVNDKNKKICIKNPNLFIINADHVKLNIESIMQFLQKRFEVVPKLGCTYKKHYSTMPANLRFLFQDILLMPASYEDFMNRIDVWIRTYEILNDEQFCFEASES